MRVLHVLFVSYKLLTRSRLVYSVGNGKICRGTGWGVAVGAICLHCEKKIGLCGRGRLLGAVSRLSSRLHLRGLSPDPFVRVRVWAPPQLASLVRWRPKAF